MIKFVALLLLFVPASSTPSSAKMLYYDLKGITAINYHAYVDQDSNRCQVERDSFDTALQFVANQSVKLKLIPFREWYARNRILLDTENALSFSIRSYDEGAMDQLGARHMRGLVA